MHAVKFQDSKKPNGVVSNYNIKIKVKRGKIRTLHYFTPVFEVLMAW